MNPFLFYEMVIFSECCPGKIKTCVQSRKVLLENMSRRKLLLKYLVRTFLWNFTEEIFCFIIYILFSVINVWSTEPVRKTQQRAHQSSSSSAVNTIHYTYKFICMDCWQIANKVYPFTSQFKCLIKVVCD